MIELSATIILFIGLIGMGVIVFLKIPVLAELPAEESKKPKILRVLKEKIKENDKIRSLSRELLLQKILSKIRVFTLKTDSKTSAWLAKLRQKSIKKKNNFSDNYWQRLKKK